MDEERVMLRFRSNIKTGEHNLRDIYIQLDARSAFRVACNICSPR